MQWLAFIAVAVAMNEVMQRLGSNAVVMPRCKTLQQRVVTVAGQCSGLPSLLWLLR
jgi:hypothetical protein